MRNGRGRNPLSRAERHRSKTDRWLNWAIGIVSLLILATGCVILISIFNTTPSDKTATPSQNQSGAQSNGGLSSSDSGQGNGTSDQNEDSDSAAGSDSEGTVDNEESSTEDGSEERSSSSESSFSDSESGEEHQASYDKGTPDWNAQVAAVSEATGIPESNMTIHWLGNGGSPSSSLARVSPKDDQDAKWVVHLVYKDGQWEADDVQSPQ